jgi:hypothetical protein
MLAEKEKEEYFILTNGRVLLAEVLPMNNDQRSWG